LAPFGVAASRETRTVPSTDPTARVYQELAKWYEQQRDGPMRDRFLLLAAAALLSSGHKEEAEKLRIRLLELSPSHLLKPFSSLAEAVKSRDIRDYIDGLRRNYSPQAAEQLLESLRREKGGHAHERAASASPGPGPELPALETISARRPSAGKSAPSPGSGRDHSQSKEPSVPQHRTETAAKSASPVRARTESPRTSWRDGWLEADKPEPPPGAWLSTLLFWLMVLGTAALAGYLFGRPLLNF
jgi:hypothetical protein